MLMGLFHTNECGFPSHPTAPGAGSLSEPPVVNDRPFSALDSTAGQFPSFAAHKAQGLLREGGAGDARKTGRQSDVVCSAVSLVLEGLQLHQLRLLFHVLLV